MKTKLYGTLTVLTVLFFCAGICRAADFFEDQVPKPSPAIKQQMMNNVYPVSPGTLDEVETAVGGCMSFRLHKRWLLTAAHCFGAIGNKNMPVNIHVKKNKATGYLGYNVRVLPPDDNMFPANGMIYFYKQGWADQNGGPSADIALIYIGDASKKKKSLLDMTGVPPQLRAKMPPELLKQISAAENAVYGDDRAAFFNESIPDFSILTLTEGDVIDTLRPVKNPKKYSYSFFRVNCEKADNCDNKLEVFDNIYSNGTMKGTNLLFFYPNTNAVQGASGSPIIYSNIVVSLLSGADAGTMMSGPMFITDTFYDFLTKTMGADYRKGMCVKAEKAEGEGNGIEVPVYVPLTPK